jgi:hypothetical protein
VTVDEAHGAVLAVQHAVTASMAPSSSWRQRHRGRRWSPGCLSARGGVLTGFGLAVEIGDWHRFTGATVGAWPGLVPSEQSSGSRRSQGSITKTGNGHARRLLVEAAWHHANPIGPAATCAPDRTDNPRWSENAPRWATAGCSSAVPTGRSGQALHHQRGRGRP